MRIVIILTLEEEGVWLVEGCLVEVLEGVLEGIVLPPFELTQPLAKTATPSRNTNSSAAGCFIGFTNYHSRALNINLSAIIYSCVRINIDSI